MKMVIMIKNEEEKEKFLDDIADSLCPFSYGVSRKCSLYKNCVECLENFIYWAQEPKEEN